MVRKEMTAMIDLRTSMVEKEMTAGDFSPEEICAMYCPPDMALMAINVISGLRADIKQATREVDDMAMLIRQLVHSLRKAAPDHSLPDRATDYVVRNGLQGSPLRDE